MQNWIIEVMNQFGYAGITVLIAIENIFPPIPSEVILTFGGFMTTYTDLSAWGVIISSTFGSFIGAIVLYGAGRRLSPEHLEKLIEGKVGQILHFKNEDILNAVEWFNSKGKSTVLFCRCIPVIRSVISVPAGMAKMKPGIFCILTIIGSFVWNTILVYLGVTAGASWSKITAVVGMYANVTLVLIGLGIVIAGVYLVKMILKGK